MNPAFFDLPQGKRQNLVNAGYRAFSLSPYSKASMAAVAAEAGISKALLFYYFQNKQEYYLYLFAQAMNRKRQRLEPFRQVSLTVCWVKLSVRRRLRCARLPLPDPLCNACLLRNRPRRTARHRVQKAGAAGAWRARNPCPH